MSKMSASEQKKIVDTYKTTELFNRIAPNAVKFFVDHYVCGNTFRSVWAIIGYMYSTEEMAILKELSGRREITFHIRHQILSTLDESRIISAAEKKNYQERLSRSLTTATNASEDHKDLALLLRKKRKEKEPLLDVSVFIEIRAESKEMLRSRQEEVKALLTQNKIEYDRLLTMQKEGFLATIPGGQKNQSLRNQRVMPASSAANLFPFSYAGKIDPEGFRIGSDKFGGDIIVDLDRRTSDKSNSHVIIAGNSGEGKSYLAKLLTCCVTEKGKRIIVIDPEGEYRDIINNLGGTYIDCDGAHIINPLEPRDNSDDEDNLRNKGIVSRHIAFLRDFFAGYKSSFTEPVIDTLDILLSHLYKSFGISDESPIPASGRYPILSDLYGLANEYYNNYESLDLETFPVAKNLLRDLLLALNSICIGADSLYFNGQTNLPESNIIAFGFRELLETNQSLLSVSLFNAFSYMHNALIQQGSTVGLIDELHLFFNYPVAVKHIRSAIKRARKNDSFLILATQNIEDFLQPGIKELTKPLFTIPAHSFLFYPGTVSVSEFRELTSLAAEEYALISRAHRGSCLYRCGAERFLLQVEAPPHKASLFGHGGGR